MDVLGIDNVFVEVGDLDQAVQLGRVRAAGRQKRFDDIGSILFHIAGRNPGARGRCRTDSKSWRPEGAVRVADPWGNVIGLTDYSTMPQLGRPGTSP